MPTTETRLPITMYPPGTSSDDVFAQGICAGTPEEFAHLEAAGWIIAAEFYRPMRERETAERAAAAAAAQKARVEVERREKAEAAEQERVAAEAKLKAEAEAAAAKIARQREEQDAFLGRCHRAVVGPLEERRSWVNDRLRRIAYDLGSALMGGWDGWDPALAEEALNLDAELETIAQRLAEADQELNRARAEEQRKWNAQQ